MTTTVEEIVATAEEEAQLRAERLGKPTREERLKASPAPKKAPVLPFRYRRGAVMAPQWYPTKDGIYDGNRKQPVFGFWFVFHLRKGRVSLLTSPAKRKTWWYGSFKGLKQVSESCSGGVDLKFTSSHPHVALHVRGEHLQQLAIALDRHLAAGLGDYDDRRKKPARGVSATQDELPGLR